MHPTAIASKSWTTAWMQGRSRQLKEKKHCQAVMEYKSGPLRQTLEEAIFYFESLEEYEKCAFLYTIQKLKEKS